MALIYKFRSGKKEDLPVLRLGEPGVCTDSKQVFVGTGNGNIELAKTDYIDEKIASLVGSSKETLDTLEELGEALGNDPDFAATMTGLIGKKVDKVEGEGLTPNKFTDVEKAKLANIAENANNYTHPTGDGNSHVPSTGTANNGKVLKAGAAANSSAWGNIAFSELTNKPTTLSGYGITDAVTPEQVNEKVDLFSTVYTTTGTENNYVLTIPNITSYEQLTTKTIHVIFHIAGSSTTININVNGLGNKRLYLYETIAPNAAAIKSNAIYGIYYNGTAFIITNAGNPPTTHATTDTAFGASSTTHYGHIRIAADAMIDAGTDTSTAVTPRQLVDTMNKHADSPHAPSDAQANVIEEVKVNGVKIEPVDKVVDIPIIGSSGEFDDELLNELLDRISRLESDLLSGMKSKQFSIGFDNLAELSATHGIWNKPLDRIEC